MLRHFEHVINGSGLRKGGKAWDHKTFHIRYRDDSQIFFVSQADLAYLDASRMS